jgi:hypothetical protein
MGNGKKRYHVDDFIPRIRAPRIMSGEHGLAMMKMITAMQKGQEAIGKMKSGRMGEDI